MSTEDSKLKRNLSLRIASKMFPKYISVSKSKGKQKCTKSYSAVNLRHANKRKTKSSTKDRNVDTATNHGKRSLSHRFPSLRKWRESHTEGKSLDSSDNDIQGVNIGHIGLKGEFSKTFRKTLSRKYKSVTAFRKSRSSSDVKCDQQSKLLKRANKKQYLSTHLQVSEQGLSIQLKSRLNSISEAVDLSAIAKPRQIQNLKGESFCIAETKPVKSGIPTISVTNKSFIDSPTCADPFGIDEEDGIFMFDTPLCSGTGSVPNIPQIHTELIGDKDHTDRGKHNTPRNPLQRRSVGLMDLCRKEEEYENPWVLQKETPRHNLELSPSITAGNGWDVTDNCKQTCFSSEVYATSPGYDSFGFVVSDLNEIEKSVGSLKRSSSHDSIDSFSSSVHSAQSQDLFFSDSEAEVNVDQISISSADSGTFENQLGSDKSFEFDASKESKDSAKKEMTKITPKVKAKRKNGISLEEGGDIAGKLARKLFGKQVSMETALKTRKNIENKENKGKDEKLKRRSLDSNLKIKQMTLDLESMTDATLKWVGSSDSGLSSALSPVFEIGTSGHDKAKKSKSTDLDESKKYYTLPNPRKSRVNASTPKKKMSLESISKKLSEKAHSLSNLKLSSSFKLRNIKNEDSKLNTFLKTNSWTNLVVKKGAEVASNISTLMRKRSNSNSASNSPFMPRTSRVKTDKEREKVLVYEKVKLYAPRKSPVSTDDILKWRKRLKLNIDIAQGREKNIGIRSRADSYIARFRSSSSLSPIVGSPTLLDEIMKSVERVRFNFRDSLITDGDFSDGEDSSCCSSPPIFNGSSNVMDWKPEDSCYPNPSKLFAHGFISMCKKCGRIRNDSNENKSSIIYKQCQRQKQSLSLCDLNNSCQCSNSDNNRLKLPHSVDMFNITRSDKSIKRSDPNLSNSSVDAEFLLLSSKGQTKTRRPVSMLELRNIEEVVIDSPEDEVDSCPGALFRHQPRHNLSDDNLDDKNLVLDTLHNDIKSPSYEDLILNKRNASSPTTPNTPNDLLSPGTETPDTYHSCSESMDTEISVPCTPSNTQTDYKKSHSCGNLVDDVEVFVENKLRESQDAFNSKEVRKAKVKSLSSSHDALNTFVQLDKLSISKDRVTSNEKSNDDKVIKDGCALEKKSEKEALDDVSKNDNIKDGVETVEICDSTCKTCDELESENDNPTINLNDTTCAKCEKLRHQVGKKTELLKYHKLISVNNELQNFRTNHADIGKPPISKFLGNKKTHSLDDMMRPENVSDLKPNRIQRYSMINSSSPSSYCSSPVLSPVSIEIDKDINIKETCYSAPSTPFIKSHRKTMFDFNENDIETYTHNTLAPPNLGRLKSVSSENMASAKTQSPKTGSWVGGLKHTRSDDTFTKKGHLTVPNLLGKLGNSKSTEFTESCPLSMFPDVPGPDVVTMYKYDVGLGYLLHSIECGNQTICFYSFQRNKQLMESVITPLAALPGVTGTKPAEAGNANKPTTKSAAKVKSDTHPNPAAPIINIPSEKLSHAGRVIRTVLLTRASHMIRDRKFHLRTYRRCMVGTEMVDWLIQQSPLVHSRTQAIGMWQALVEEGVVVHVCHEHQFKDKYLFYRFNEDDEGVSTVPNTVTKRESEEELQDVFLMLAQIGPDAMMRMILRKLPHERTMEDLEIIYEELLHIKALSHLSTMVKRELASVLVFESHAKAGTVLFNQGDEGKSWYIILKGSVNVVIYGKGVVCTLHEGDDFGKLALVNDAPRAATIVLRDDNCHFLRVDKDDFNRILRDVEANTVRLKEHGQDVLVLEKIPSNSKSADGTVHTHYKYSVMAGTPEKMLEYLLETRLEGKKEDEIDGFLEDFLLTHVIFMPNNHLCPVLLSHYHSSMADTNEQEAYEISLNHKKCVLHFVKEWANTVGMAFRADQTINAFLEELHSCILEDLSVYSTLKEDVAALETILHAQAESPDCKSKKKNSGNFTLSRKLSKENQTEVVSKVKPVKPSDETIFKVYCADHTYSTLKLPMDTSVEKLLYSTKEKLGLGDDLILCEVKSTGERIVFKENDLCVISGLSINGRLFITPKEHLDALTPLPEQEGPQDGTFSAIELISSREMAYYMTMYDWELFMCVQEYELIYQVFGRYKFGKITANLDLFLRRFNEIQYWVVTEMVLTTNLSKRVSLLRKFIKIASHCKEFQNLNSFFAIVMGLSNIAVSRLSQTWEKLPSKFKKLFAEFETLMDPSRNHRVYRLSVAKMAPPIIPFMPLLMKDMTFTHEGNKTYFDGLVNFEKMHMISQTLKTVRFCRSSNLDLETPSSVKSSDTAGYIRTLTVIDNQRRLTKLSHKVEPRKT